MLCQNNLVFYVFFIFVALAQAQVDKPCTVRHNGASGICKVDVSCPKVAADAERGIQPTICGVLYSSIIIVCCEGATVTNVQANENSFVDVESQDNDRIIYESDTSDASESLSERKCMEYNKNTVESVEVIPLVSNPRPSSVQIAKCSYNGNPLVVGGEPALPGEFPFMAVLGYSGSDDEVQWNCGGTLISDYYVMTAAHCAVTKKGQPVLVRLGELDLSKDNDNSSPEDFGVSQVKVHPNYHPIYKANDIALIKLSKRVKFNNFIRPACLWNKRNVKHTSAIATGWGATENAGRQSDILQKVSIDLLDKSVCDRTYKNIKHYKNGLPTTMLCAGVLKGGKDTCQGDSGGPLSVTKVDNHCIFYTVGITSFGRMCALENTPAIYTRVSEFIPWIEGIIWQ